jgi:hypothetical protein
MKELLEPPHTSDEKLRWEIAKLRAEVDSLRRVTARNLSLFFAALTTLAGIAGIFYQARKSNVEYTLAETKRIQTEIERQRTDAELAQLLRKRAEVKQLLDGASAQLVELTARRDSVEHRLAEAQLALNRAQGTVQADGGAGADIAAATAHVQAATRENQRRAQETQTAIQRVDELRREVGAIGAAAIVTGQFGSLDEARRDAASTQVKGYSASAFVRNTRYRTAIWFTTRDSARIALPQVRERVRKSAYIVMWNEWCPDVNRRGNYYECGVSAPERIIYP